MDMYLIPGAITTTVQIYLRRNHRLYPSKNCWSIYDWIIYQVSSHLSHSWVLEINPMLRRLRPIISMKPPHPAKVKNPGKTDRSRFMVFDWSNSLTVTL